MGEGGLWTLEENIDKVPKKMLTCQTGNTFLEERVLIFTGQLECYTGVYVEST